MNAAVVLLSVVLAVTSGQQCDNSQCIGVSDPNEIQALPSCTLTQTLEKTFACIGPLIANYPYSDLASCTPKMDESFRCFRDQIVPCFSVCCPTIVHELVPNITLLYNNFLKISQIQSLDQLFLMFNVTEDLKNLITEMTCLVSDSGVVRNLTAQINQGLGNLVINVDNPICDNNLLNDLFNWSLVAFNGVVNANNRGDFCSAYSTLSSRALDAWDTRCNQNNLTLVLNDLLGNATLSATIVKAISITESFIRNYNVPNCAADSSTTTNSTSTTTSTTTTTTSTTSTANFIGGIGSQVFAFSLCAFAFHFFLN